MPKGIVLTRLDELAQYRDQFAAEGPIPAARALVPVADSHDPATFASLAEAAGAALDELRDLIAADGSRRHAAEQQLARSRDAVARAARLRQLATDMNAAADRAATLAASALGEHSRERARTIADSTRQLAASALEHAATIVREVDRASTSPDVRCLLAEEAVRVQQEEVRAVLTRAEHHLERGEHEEARHLLTSLEKSISAEPGLIPTFETLRRRVQTVKLQTAEAALREARRLHRRAPGAAIERLEQTPLDGLPDELARHLYGLWLTACRRLELLAAIHFHAGFGRGAVLIPAEDDRWEVVSALGLGWARGHRLPAQSLRGARPLG